MGLVTTAFGEVSGIAYNNAFMTGNIKRTMLAFGDYFRTKHTPFLREGLIFVSLLSSFVFGVVFFSLFDDLLSGEDNSRCSSYDEYLLLQYAFCFLEKKKGKKKLKFD